MQPIVREEISRASNPRRADYGEVAKNKWRRVASGHIPFAPRFVWSIIAINPRSAVPADAGHADKLRRAFEATRKARATVDLEEGKIAHRVLPLARK